MNTQKQIERKKNRISEKYKKNRREGVRKSEREREKKGMKRK